MFEILYAVDPLRKLDWHGKLISVRWYIGEGEQMAKMVTDYAQAHPGRWAVRQAVIERVNRTFADKKTVEEACRLAAEILKSDDAAIAEIEKALALLKE